MRYAGIVYPDMTATMKARRQGAILELIDSEPLHSQEQLRRRLLKSGFAATQAPISRDREGRAVGKRAGGGPPRGAGRGARTPGPEEGPPSPPPRGFPPPRSPRRK